MLGNYARKEQEQDPGAQTGMGRAVGNLVQVSWAARSRFPHLEPHQGLPSMGGDTAGHGRAFLGSRYR